MSTRLRAALVGACLAALALAAPAHAAFPGANGKIAFSRALDIWTVNPDGTGLTRLTNTPSQNETAPAWSPDGKKIAFMVGPTDSPPTAVWTMNSDGTGQTFVTNGLDPAWSPDGQKIVFARQGFTGEGGGIFVTDGVTETTIAPGFRDSRYPQWSSTGAKVVFAGQCTCGQSSIWTVNPDGTGLTRLSPQGTDEYAPSFAPDATKLAFFGPIFSPHDLSTMNADGTNPVQITNTPNDDETFPAWSPDGTKIAFMVRSGHPENIATSNPDGTGATLVTHDNAGDSSPDWQPVAAPYARPRGATPVRASLVVAYKPCAASNDTHGPPLAFGSCAPPIQASDFLTVGNPPTDAAASVASLRADVIPGDPATPQSEADVRLAISATDVRKKTDFGDYPGELEARLPLRLTDKDNSAPLAGPNTTGTVSDTVFAATVSCASTSDTTIGSECAATTSVNSVVPGTAKEGQRAIWELGQAQVYDGGADGVASTTGDNTLFMDQGVFVP